MKVRAILNPRAGVAAHRTREAVERGRPGWDDFAVYLTRAPGHATELAREAVASGADVVLAVGGDGTVNEVARGLIGSGAALGIVPVGSGNGLARALRLPLRARAALAALECGRRAPDGRRPSERPAVPERRRHRLRRGRRPRLPRARQARRPARAPRLRAPEPARAPRLPPDGAHARVRGASGSRSRRSSSPSRTARSTGRARSSTPARGSTTAGSRSSSSTTRRCRGCILGGSRLFLGGVERTPATGGSSGPAPRSRLASRWRCTSTATPIAPTTRIDVELVPLALRVLAPAAVVADPAGPFRPAR